MDEYSLFFNQSERAKIDIHLLGLYANSRRSAIFWEQKIPLDKKFQIC